MKNYKLLLLLLLSFLSLTFVACQGAKEMTTSLTNIEMALSDLEDAGYTYVVKDEAYLEDLKSFGPTYASIENEYTVYDEQAYFAAYILVFDTSASAQANLDARMFRDTDQAFVVYKNLLLAATDYDVIEIITGEVFSTE